MKHIDDLIRIAAKGGSLDVSAVNPPLDHLVQLATACSKSGGSLTINDVKHSDDLVKIVAAGRKSVIIKCAK